MKLHSFYPYIAERYGLHAAVLYRYLDFRAKRNPKDYVSVSLAELEAACPYLTRKQIRVALLSLCGGDKPAVERVVVSGTEKHPQRCRYYPKLNVKSRAHTFDTSIAEELGVLEAVVYANTRYWIELNWLKAADAQADELKVEDYGYDADRLNREAYRLTRDMAASFISLLEWAERHPYAPRRSVERASARLVTAGHFRKTASSDKPGYRLPDAVMDLAVENRLKTIEKAMDTSSTVKPYEPDQFEDAATPSNVTDDSASAKPLKVEQVTPSDRQKGTVTAKRAQSTAKRAQSPPKGHSATSIVSTPVCPEPSFDGRLEDIVGSQVLGKQSVEDNSGVAVATPGAIAHASSFSQPEAGSSSTGNMTTDLTKIRIKSKARKPLKKDCEPSSQPVVQPVAEPAIRRTPEEVKKMVEDSHAPDAADFAHGRKLKVKALGSLVDDPDASQGGTVGPMEEPVATARGSQKLDRKLAATAAPKPVVALEVLPAVPRERPDPKQILAAKLAKLIQDYTLADYVAMGIDVTEEGEEPVDRSTLVPIPKDIQLWKPDWNLDEEAVAVA